MHKSTIIGGVRMYPPSHRDNELTLKNIIIYEEVNNDKVEQSIKETGKKVGVGRV
jgi:hypothetical protein